ncbi:MAG: tRNA pseudouridine(55) synthase TruB [Solobacterium sp.]|nr:tRNA pseudouridine(55) synthase TruB [Solobacterium sp.]
MNKILLIHKPAGMTSFAAVSRCRRILGEKKAGHTGTLDPNASGLMIVLLGKYTKLLPYCICDHKHYLAQFSFGIRSDTGDIWGNILERKSPGIHTEVELKKISASFLGESEQIPPMYSAVKVQGKKLYELARKGREVERKPRKIRVSSLDVYPIGNNLYAMDAVVSSGTYIRTLIEDYAAKLSECAVMTSLVRTGIEHLTLSQAADLEQLERGDYPEISPEEIIDPRFPLIEITDPAPVYHGKPVSLETDEDIVLLTYEGEILAAYEYRTGGEYHCLRGLW